MTSKNSYWASKKLNEGLEFHRKGLLEKAKDIYLKIIKNDKTNFDALQLLGALELQRNKYENALEFLKKALNLNKKNANLYYNLGMVLHKLNQLEEARGAYDKAIDLNEKFNDAYTNKGNVLKDLGEIELAINCYEKAISINPNEFKAYSNKAAALKIKEKYADAMSNINRALEINPNYAEAHCNKADIQKELQYFDDAIHSYSRAIELNSSFINAISNKGVCLTELKKYKEAMSCYENALKIDENEARVWCNKGVTFNLLNMHEDAITCFNNALEIESNYAEAWSNRGVALLALGRIEESIFNSNRAIELKKDLPQPHLHLAQAYLSIFEYAKGWKEYEWRFKIKFKEKQVIPKGKPKWAGNKNNITLLVWCEQGVGDQILYSSIFSELSQSLQKVVVLLNKKLIPLYERSYGNIKFLDSLEHIEDSQYDEQISMGSLMRYFRNSVEDFKRTKFPYLISDTKKTNEYKKEINIFQKMTCGISWKSSNQQIGEFKSIELNALRNLITNEKIKFINLQYEHEEFKDSDEPIIHQYMKNIDGLDIYNDIDSLASLIQACDLIITCSNTTAHLAGALNKATLLLLPAGSGRFWYWSEINSISNWYPSVKIFQQDRVGDWGNVVNDLIKHLDRELNDD